MMKVIESDGLKSVSSDCKPLSYQIRLGVEEKLGRICKLTDSKWRERVQGIYNQYQPYNQADGKDQSVFGDGLQLPIARSAFIVKKLLANIKIANIGDALDIGCGNGTFLSELSRGLESWNLYGSEVNELHRQRVLNIPGVKDFFTTNLEGIPGQYDLVSIVHVLEHITDPVSFLADISSKLKRGGHLFIELPYYIQNPFELAIYDHCSHFTKQSITRLLCTSGFEVVLISTDWISKEISIIATKTRVTLRTAIKSDTEAEIETIKHALAWLKKFRQRCIEKISNVPNPIGIFGTSIGATWLYQEIGEKVGFFIDEDPNRIGRRHLECPIFAPEEIPEDSLIAFPLPTTIAENVVNRLDIPLTRVILPGPLPNFEID